MLQNSRIPFQADLRNLVIGPEIKHRLGDLIETARLNLRPRDFAENYLVDEMAISKWRGIRTKIMEKAVYDHQAVTFRPRGLKDTKGQLLEPHEDMYHLAMAHAPETSRIVLTALGRLETRYYRHFCGSFRLLLSARRGTPPPLTDLDQTLDPISGFTSKTNTAKENSPCKPSPNSSQPTQ